MRRGDVVEGRYQLVDEAGSGAMGTVWRAIDLRLGREVAIKKARGDAGTSRLRDEGCAAAALRHPNVVVVHDVGTSAGEDFLVMEYVPGPSLREVLVARGRLDEAEAIRIVTGILSGLAHAHSAGLWHGDVKPENVLLGDDGIARLTDFSGGSYFLPTVAVSDAGTLLTTVAYAPPELLAGAPGGPAADLYAAAMVLYESVTGSLPLRLPGGGLALFGETEPTPGVSPRLRAVLSRALHEEPGVRYQSADSLLRDLQGAGQAWPPVRLDTAVASPTHPLRKSQKWLPAIALGAIVLSAGSAGLILREPGDSENNGVSTPGRPTEPATATLPNTATPTAEATVAPPVIVEPQQDDGSHKSKKPKNPGRGNEDR